MKTFLYRFLPWLLAVGLLWWVLRSVELAAVWRVLQQLAFGELLWLAVAVGLLGMYYHFAGDILAGTGLGVFVASLVIRCGNRIPTKALKNSD